ncbi:cell wall-binding repeat-containing protein [Euzebya tangerina]|uniref:cell wall-binding repeat-containing protein n=1 Tax=Euzebya tangerina TaxID=591198 RepID=UPI000E315AB6|nr:cell wall-binding repeat-containing protein [Euzebya tangerina]
MSTQSPVARRLAIAVAGALLLVLGFGALAPQQADAIDGPVPVVFIARADVFADALAGGPLASLNGSPLLLTSSATLSPETATELERLDPDRIVILGGEAAITAEVATALESFADSVERIGGTTRTETAALIAAALPGTVDADSVGGITPDQIITEDEAAVFLTADDVAGFLTADDLDGLDADTIDGLDSSAFVPAEVSIPFFEQLDSGTGTILAEHGPLTLALFCQDEGAAIRAELGVSTSVDGAFGDENSSGFDVADGFVDLADSEEATPPSTAFDNDIDEGVAMVQDGDQLYKLSVDGESTAYAVNLFEADCTVAGIINLQQTTVGTAEDTIPAVPVN